MMPVAELTSIPMVVLTLQKCFRPADIFQLSQLRRLVASQNNYIRTACYKVFNLLKPTGHVMHQPFNIQQLYVLPTLYLCVLYLSENKQRLVSLTA